MLLWSPEMHEIAWLAVPFVMHVQDPAILHGLAMEATHNMIPREGVDPC